MKTVYFNGKVYTGSLPLCEAFVVENGSFIYAGNTQDALAVAGNDAKKRNLNGSFVCSGFIDSHMHILDYGQALNCARLDQHTDSLSDMLECLKKFLSSPLYHEGSWLIGRGWNHDYFTDVHREPNRWDLDRISAEIPIAAIRCCGHSMAVNSKVLEIMGITADTPQPEGGSIGIEDGEPNGMIYDNSMDAVMARFPAPTKEQLKDMILLACHDLNAHGVTGAHSDDYSIFKNIPWQEVQECFRELDNAHALTVKVYEQSNFTSPKVLQEFLDAGNCTGIGTEMFRTGPLKMVADGSLGARTAYLRKPYADDPTTRGFPLFTREELFAMTDLAHRSGMQIAVHEIGDAGVDDLLDALEEAQKQYPSENRRHGIVHCQITRPDQLERMVKMKLHVYAQPIFLDYDIHIVEKRVGKELAQSSYSWKTLLRHGVTVSSGTDCPVELPDALKCIQCAVTRCSLDGTGPYLPKEAFTVQEAIDSYTIGSAYASFEENTRGRIAPGYAADFVIIDKNLFETEHKEISKAEILATYLDGKKVYSVN